MKTTLLRSIRTEARNWWYQPDNPVRIRESMRRDLQTLRTALLATIGRGGSTIYLSDGSRLTASWPIPLIQHLACPVVDLRTIPFDQLVHFSIHGPMVDPTRTEDEGPGAFDWVTTATYVRLARAVGAEVYNFPER